MAIKSKPRKTTKAPPPESGIKVSGATIKELTGVFKLLADGNRLKIVMALAQNGKMHVSDLCEMLGQSQPAVSHHLTLMRMVGLLSFDRSGKHNFYYLNTAYVSELFEQVFRDIGEGKKTLEFEDFGVTFSRQGEE